MKTMELLDLAVRAPRWRMMRVPLFRETETQVHKDTDKWYSYFHRMIQPLYLKGDDSRWQQ